MIDDRLQRRVAAAAPTTPFTPPPETIFLASKQIIRNGSVNIHTHAPKRRSR